jgi:hypothetical protein
MIFSVEPIITKFGGLLEYKPQWTLSLKGWLILMSLLLANFWIFIQSIHSFLTFSQPLEVADILLIEGWLNGKTLEGVVKEYQKRNYKMILIPGFPMNEEEFSNGYQSYPEKVAKTLIKLGIESQKIVTIVIPYVETNRTAETAIAVKNWLKKSNLSLNSLNIYSYDIHTRRSYLIYQKILKPEIKVGAIAYPSPHYNPQKWWRSSYGVKIMINEIIGYFYARFIWFYFQSKSANIEGENPNHKQGNE